VSETIHYRFLVRGGTAANLAAVNEVPKHRELIVETDTGKLKLGNGTTPYNDLDYIGGGGGGSAWLNGTGAPDAGDGEDGDYYLDTDTGDVYARAAGAWELEGNIKGPEGAVGPAGPAGEASTVPGPVGPPGPSSSCFPTASFDGGTANIASGAFCDLFVPFGFNITRATLLADEAGTFQVDVRSVPFAAFPPGPGDSICGGNAPALIGSNRVQDGVLSGWTTAVPAGSVIRFVVTASAGVRRATLTLEGARD
jgi:hypothetical protein